MKYELCQALGVLRLLLNGKFSTVDERDSLTLRKDQLAKGWSRGKFSLQAKPLALTWWHWITPKVRIASGDNAETVRQETGWHRGDDGKWRFEISDDHQFAWQNGREVIDSAALDAINGNRKFPFRPNRPCPSCLLPTLSSMSRGRRCLLAARLWHDYSVELQASRSSCAKACREIRWHPQSCMSFSMAFRFTKALQLADLKNIVFSDLESGAKAYRLLAGEVEARNTQTRQTMTPNLRRNIAPSSRTRVMSRSTVRT